MPNGSTAEQPLPARRGRARSRASKKTTKITRLYPDTENLSSSFVDDETRSLVGFASEAELVDAICREIPPLYPAEARRQIARFGPVRCECSLVHTMLGIEAGTVYSPPGWFIKSMVNNREPSRADLREEPFASTVERLRQRRNGGSGQADQAEDWLERRYRRGKDGESLRA